MVDIESYDPISKKILRDSDRLVVTYPRSGGGVNAYAMTVMRKARISLQYTEMDPIPAGDSLPLGKLGEDGHSEQVASSGDDVFRIPDTKVPYRAYHLSLLVQPEGLKVFMGYPEDTTVQGMYRETKVDVDSELGFEWSEHTHYDERMPSDALEMVKPPGNLIYMGFQNPLGADETPYIYAYGSAYDIAPINEYDRDLAYDITVGRIPRTIKPIGALKNFNLNIPDEWGEPIALDREEVGYLSNGGE